MAPRSEKMTCVEATFETVSKNGGVEKEEVEEGGEEVEGKEEEEEEGLREGVSFIRRFISAKRIQELLDCFMKLKFSVQTIW